MKKSVIVLVLLLLFITGCNKMKPLRTIFKENNYVDLGSTFAYADRANQIGIVYAFDTEVQNNYFAYNKGEDTGIYYYKKHLISMNECIYNVEDGSYSETCVEGEVDFLKLTEEKFRETNKTLGISIPRLTVNSDGLD